MNKGTVVVTGAAGFIGGHLIQELLESGWTVRGFDNCSKYGRDAKPRFASPDFTFTEGDVKETSLFEAMLGGSDYLIACAAMVGGVGFINEFEYDLFAENNAIIAATINSARAARTFGQLRKLIYVSSSMVYENTTRVPATEGSELISAAPSSGYGKQRLGSEALLRAAHRQHGLPYTIIRPTNCVGAGIRPAIGSKPALSGNVQIVFSHVIPDIIQKILKGQDPLRILGNGAQTRQYIHSSDLVRGIRIAMESPAALNEDFNLTTPEATTVLELAQMIWQRLKPGEPFRYISDPAPRLDTRLVIADWSKAARVLGFEASTPIAVIIDEMIEWTRKELRH